MNTEKESTQPVNEPKQRRSAYTQEKILSVVERHLLDGTYEDISVQDIVRESGCSVGAFYGRFANKAGAMYHFYDGRCQELEKLVADVLDPSRGAPLSVLLQEFVHIVVYRTFSYASIIRSDVLRVSTGADNSFSSRARDLNAVLLASLLQCLSAREAELSHKASHENALFVLAMVGGLARDAVINSDRIVKDSGGFTLDSFIVELERAVNRYLGVLPVT